MTKTTKRIVNLDLVRGPILTVWNAIAPDFAELGPMTNTAAIEACIDANRITFFAGSSEQDKAAAHAAETGDQ